LKIVREHINEKFAENSDPIHDMGIGEDYLWKNLKKGDVLEIIVDINSMMKKGYLQRVDKIQYITHPHLKILMYFTIFQNEKELLKNKKSFNNGSSYSYNYLKDNYKIFKFHGKKLKESLNEKFVEDSDPIADMGIGIEVVLKDSLKKIFELGKEDAQKLYIRSSSVDKPFNHLSKSSIREIIFLGNRLNIGLYSNQYYTNNKKLVNKKIYTDELLKKSGLYFLIKRFIRIYSYYPSEKGYDIYEISYLVKPEYRKYVTNKAYYSEQDI
jgi:hypothetical protein